MVCVCVVDTGGVNRDCNPTGCNRKSRKWEVFTSQADMKFARQNKDCSRLPKLNLRNCMSQDYSHPVLKMLLFPQQGFLLKMKKSNKQKNTQFRPHLL